MPGVGGQHPDPAATRRPGVPGGPQNRVGFREAGRTASPGRCSVGQQEETCFRRLRPNQCQFRIVCCHPNALPNRVVGRCAGVLRRLGPCRLRGAHHLPCPAGRELCVPDGWGHRPQEFDIQMHGGVSHELHRPLQLGEARSDLPCPHAVSSGGTPRHRKSQQHQTQIAGIRWRGLGLPLPIPDTE